jgi:hypothetical protein
MNRKLKVSLIVVLSGLLLGMLPLTWLSAADEHHAHSSDPENIVNASIQFVLVHIERERLEELLDELDVQTMDSIPLERIGQCVRAKDGAEIVSQTIISTVAGFEAGITLIENDNHQAKISDKNNVEEGKRETELSIKAKVELNDKHRLAVRFSYDRTVSEEAYNMQEEAEEEESIKQQFSLSSGIMMQPGKMHVAGAHLNEDGAVVLMMKATL